MRKQIKRRRRPRPSVTTLQRQQIGAGFGVLLKTLPRLLRSFGPKLGALTRSVRGVGPKLGALTRGSRTGLAHLRKTVPKTARTIKKTVTKKNLKRLGTAATIAAGTGAVSGGAQHAVRKLLGE